MKTLLDNDGYFNTQFLNELIGQDKIRIFYHGNCLDGFTAAWVFYKFGVPKEAMIPCTYGKFYKDLSFVQGRSCIFVDFCFKRAEMELLAGVADSVVVLDHHKTQMDDMAGFDEIGYQAVWDMTRSGAGIAWDAVFGSVYKPAMLEYVQDRDLWTFKHHATRNANAYMFSFPYDFDKFTELMNLKGNELITAISAGASIRRKQEKDIKEFLPLVRREFVLDPINSWCILVNVPYFWASEACEMLYKEHPEADFVGGYYIDKDGHTVLSLRSAQDSPIDVGAIAKLFGGGGHRHASGCTVSSIYSFIERMKEEYNKRL